MSFQFNEQHSAIRERVREFRENHCDVLRMQELTDSWAFPDDLYEALTHSGTRRSVVPRAVGASCPVEGESSMSSIAKTIAFGAVVTLATPTSSVAMEDLRMDEFRSWMADHQGTTWSGESELWLDPMGNDADVSDASLAVDADKIVYSWVYKGAAQSGELRWNGDALRWKDSWHQPASVALTLVPGHGSLIAAEYSYAAGTGPDWHWRIKLAERPDGALVLQMTNIAPWGEEARAVRTVIRPSE